MRRASPPASSFGAGVAIAAAVSACVFVVAGASGASSSFPGKPGLIAVESERDADEATQHVLIVRPDGTGAHRLTMPGFRQERGPVWSPDGLRIAFTASLPGSGRGAIFIANADGTGLHRVTRGSHADGGAVWSPDGSKLVFISLVKRLPQHRGLFGLFGLFVMRVNGTGRHLLVPASACPRSPSWSPDGTMIAFQAGCVVVPGVEVVRSDGSRRKLVFGDAREPSWSPDGTMIAFHRGDQVWAVSPEGRNPQVLVAGVAGAHGAPAWSPDGQAIAVVGNAPGCLGKGMNLVDIVSLPSGQPRPLLRDCADNYSPSWQPVCTIYGTTGDDTLVGTPGDDLICALAGNDTIRAGAGDDVVLGGDGNDVIDGGPGRDRLFGAAGADLLKARDGEADEIVDGGFGTDRAAIDIGLDPIASVRGR